MDKLTVDFIGICTHILTNEETWPHPHRVVLPRSAAHHPHTGFLIIAKTDTSQDVQAFARELHGALGYSETADAYQLTLQGVELAVDNGTGDYAWDDKTFRCGIFSVQDFAGGQPLGKPNEDVARRRFKHRAHAYFDIPSGLLSAKRVDESSAAVLDVNTTAAPRLRAKSFEGNHEAVLELRSGAAIQITHTTHDSDDRHFLMHFELASNPVNDPTYPTEPAPCLEPDYGTGIGPGCSNSTFP